MLHKKKEVIVYPDAVKMIPLLQQQRATTAVLAVVKLESTQQQKDNRRKTSPFSICTEELPALGFI